MHEYDVLQSRLHRIQCPGGLASHRVDLQDHSLAAGAAAPRVHGGGVQAARRRRAAEQWQSGSRRRSGTCTWSVRALHHIPDTAAAILAVSAVARALDTMGRLPNTLPLSRHRDKLFYVMRTDALDRFGTRLEQRSSREQIRAMLEAAGFANVRSSDRSPFWCAVALKD